MRRAAKRDGNESEIVEAIRAAGYWCVQVSHAGLPDLVCGRKGRPTICLLEVKDGNGQLTDAQLEFFRLSEGAYRFVVRSPESAVKILETWVGGANGSSEGVHGN